MPDLADGPTLRTARLVLRPWRAEDLAPFAALNADPAVMAHFPATLSQEESDALAGRLQTHFRAYGFGWWAVEAPDAPFVGIVGLAHVRFAAPFTPAVEIGWRLAKEHWRRGYAGEAARAALEFAFGDLGLDEVVSFTAVVNAPSRAVMASLGMAHDPAGDFDHPSLPEGHRLRRHVLYRLARPAA